MPQGTAWGRRLALALALASSLLGAASWPSPASAAASPAWSLSLSSYPTVFSPGEVAAADRRPPGFLLVATNIGGAATSGEFSLTASLPPGLEPTTAAGAVGSYGPAATALTCELDGNAIACSGGKPGLQAGQIAVVHIPVAVSAPAPSSLTIDAAVEGGGAAATSVSLETRVDSGPIPFSLLPAATGPGDLATGPDGAAVTQAGSHPYEVRAGLGFPTEAIPEAGLRAVEGGVKDLAVDLPRGLVANPHATATRCTEDQLETDGVGCPDSSQVGLLRLDLSFGEAPDPSLLPLYNMVPPSGTAVEFGAQVVEGLMVHVSGGLRTGGDLGLSATVENIPAKATVAAAEVALWGDPSDPKHDRVRGQCVKTGAACSTEPVPDHFLTMPTECGGPLTAVTRAASWLHPDVETAVASASTALDGCNRLKFAPSFEAVPTSRLAGLPTGLALAVRMPQADDGDGLSEASLRDASLRLPEGMVLSPAAADGLAACSPAQIGLASAPGERPIRFGAAPATCPDAAKIGTVEARTPLIDHVLRGSVFVAEQGRNPFGSRFAVYLTLEDPDTGIVVKLAGRVDADPASGRLTARFEELPQLPLEELRTAFFEGPRAVFRTPAVCGDYEAEANLVPWSSPEALDVERSSGFAVAAAPRGGCPRSEAALPADAELQAGSAAPHAGAYSPFVLRLSRPDGSQALTGIDVRLPPGVGARLAGVERCPAAAADSGACPAGAAVGKVTLLAGSGPLPLRLTGSVYLAGPYRGAPLSLLAAVPAVAGPFDLGSVTVRVALEIDRRTAVVHAVSDPLPTIVSGVPVDLRSLQISLDRPRFARTPTSCEPMAIAGTALLGSGSSALSQRYQVGGCSRLGFAPRASARLLGSTHRGAHPGLRVTIARSRAGAALRRVGFTLPSTQLLDSTHIRGICAVDPCGASSRYGRLRVWSPMLDEPLAGPVFLRAGPHRLPDLSAALRGEVDLDLVGRLDSVRGRLRGTFQGLPDVPLSRAVLTMRGGSRGLFVNTGGFCAREPRVGFSLSAHNAASRELQPRLRGRCSDPD